MLAQPPGAALLASTGIIHGGWSAAVGAFLMTGVLILLTGLWPRLGALIASIPTPIAQAMLAGIVLELCLTPVRGFVAHPAEVGPIVLVWLAFRRVAPKWAAPAAFGAALIVIGFIAASKGGVHGSLLPHGPRRQLPLYVVTMAGQNVPEARRCSPAMTSAVARSDDHHGHRHAAQRLRRGPCDQPRGDQRVARRRARCRPRSPNALDRGGGDRVAGLALLGTLASSLAGGSGTTARQRPSPSWSRRRPASAP